MMIRELTEKDAVHLSRLLIDMYQHLDNIEGFVPIPYDNLNVRCMLTDSRYYFLGAFENDIMVGVICLDYLCSDLLETTGLQEHFKFEKIVELNFVIVHSNFRKRGIMKELLNHALEHITANKFGVLFGKANKFNFATISSYLKSQFERLFDYNQQINKEDFKFIAESEYVKPYAKHSALKTLQQFEKEKFITLKFSILVKHL